MSTTSGNTPSDFAKMGGIRPGPPSPPTHWNEERLHADANRAVGGTLNLIRELSRISQEIGQPPSPTESDSPTDWIIKRIMFLSYELHTLVATDLSERDRLAVLNEFVFHSKHFRCINDNSRLPDQSEAYRINRVLVSRAGAASVIALVYAFLAEQIGIRLEFVDLKPASFLKWTEVINGEKSRPCYIDITRAGTILSNDELIETLHTRFSLHSICNANVLETYAFETYLADYLQELKRSLGTSGNPEHLLFIQNTLISYQPSNLHLIGERALIHHCLGNRKRALADLKRYFAFHERSQSPVELVKLYQELS